MEYEEAIDLILQLFPGTKVFRSMLRKDRIEIIPRENFSEYVIRLIKEKKTKTEDFQALLRWHGREKLVKIWNDHRKGTNCNGDAKDSPNPISEDT